MMTRTQAIFSAFLASILVLSTGFFTVYETSRAIVARLGALKSDAGDVVQVYGPGLHFKLPLIDTVYVFDTRLNMTEVPSERIVTKEKEVLLVDLFVQWRIKDYARFYNATQGQGAWDELSGSDRAQQLLRQNVKDLLHAEFGQRTLQEVVSGQRAELTQRLAKRSNENVRVYGMEVVDLRVNRVEYPPEVNEKVFARMSSERKRVAVGYRASGESKAAIIRADADRVAKVMIAEAQKEAERLRGEGDASAARIYSQSFNQDPEFYRFYRSLEAYKNVFADKQDILVLKPDSAFFKYFRGDGLNLKEPEQ